MKPNYILLTAAKNEESYIGETLSSVLRQSILPLAWFIMNDGSTDRTGTIIKEYAGRYPLIRLYTVDNKEQRTFGSQYRAIQSAYMMAKKDEFEFIGVHDADIVPERVDYYERILETFQNDPLLGIAGGYIYERSSGRWECRRSNSRDSVAGGVQMFRRACFDQIGGYKPLRLGGSDWLAQIEARMAGWKVVAVPGLPIFHHRPTSSAGGRLRGLFRLGLMDASFGSHVGFEILKCGRRIVENPVLIGALIRFCGYLWWNLRGRHSVVPKEIVATLRNAQVKKVTALIESLTT